MKTFAHLRLLTLGFGLFLSCNGQVREANTNEPNPEKPVVGGAFENAGLFKRGMPEILNATDTSAAWNDNGQRLLVTGTVLNADAKTPAPNVVLYYYHTNKDGKYLHEERQPRSMPPNALGQTHGYIRGWVKTDAAGRYAIYTAKPGTYPTRDEPAHIHVTVQEPGLADAYYIDDLVFDDDVLLTARKRKEMEQRGGSGILRLLSRGNLAIAEHDIILGLNIPHYPKRETLAVYSGLEAGEDQPSFVPYHAWGPDKGSRACPVCKYGRFHGILYFVGNEPDWIDIGNWLRFLEAESRSRKKYLKVYFVYGNERDYSKDRRANELEKLGRSLKLEHVALTFVPSFVDAETEANLNKINPLAKNTFVVYRHRTIVAKFVNLDATPENFKTMSETLDKTRGDFFGLDTRGH